MPISQETAARSDAPPHEPIIDSDSNQARGTLNPSEVAPPTKVDTATQQASTMPGDGSEVHSGGVSFKDQVVGYAKVTRGTVLRKPSLKEQGERIIDGQAGVHDAPQ